LHAAIGQQPTSLKTILAAKARYLPGSARWQKPLVGLMVAAGMQHVDSSIVIVDINSIDSLKHGVGKLLEV
jgi:hypothetical protein